MRFRWCGGRDTDGCAPLAVETLVSAALMEDAGGSWLVMHVSPKIWP